MLHADVPLSLYIHVPWCVKKCPYCDFNSHAIKDDIPEQAYLQALLVDLAYELGREPRPIQTIFWGGGTPSLLSPDTVSEVMSFLQSGHYLTDDCEVTLEAKPATLDLGKWRGFLQAGINRLSVGVQSFQASQLQAIGRVHSGQQAIDTIEAAHNVGFKRINLDLMFGLPGQSEQLASDDVTQALALQPHHISYYQLTLEPNTLFYQQPPSLPEDGVIWSIYEAGQQQLAEQGFEQYEVSAYATAAQQCRHNINYWLFGDYIGVGPGAHGKQTQNGQIRRYSKPRHPQSYIQTMQTNTMPDKVAIESIVSEFMMNALRLKAGFSPELFTQRTGLSYSELDQTLNEARDKNLIDADQYWIKPTPQGWLHLNELMLCFFA